MNPKLRISDYLIFAFGLLAILSEVASHLGRVWPAILLDCVCVYLAMVIVEIKLASGKWTSRSNDP